MLCIHGLYIVLFFFFKCKFTRSSCVLSSHVYMFVCYFVYKYIVQAIALPQLKHDLELLDS